MAEHQPESELVLDDELLYDEGPRRSMMRHREDRPEDIVREGEVLAGKYRVERIPGRNGLGVLVQVRHLELGQEVTLKFLVPEACAYPEFVQRFVREARSAVRIQGEHVARVTDVGRLESGAPYMVREYLRGPDLAEVLKVRGPLPIAEAVDYIIQATEGVAEGHALGVVHRNLRPTSLVLGRRSDGTPLIKVFDFAASESLHVNPFTERAVSLVGTSAIMASLPYLAPEQIRDPYDVDFRADVYSLGAVLFELLTGTPVYAAEAAPALLAQVAADAAPSVRTLRPDAPGDLDHIVLRCLAKNRAIRYASVADLAVALRPFASQDALTSIERIVRLGKRTSKLPESVENRASASLPPVPIAPQAPASQAARGRHGTMLMHTAEPVSSQSVLPSRSSLHEDVTTINPYAAYAAPVVIHPDALRSATPRERVRTEPLPNLVARNEPPLSSQRAEAPRSDAPRQPATRQTPPPPPLRNSVPPPLRDVTQLAAPTPLPAVPLREHAQPRFETTAPPASPRSSVSGLTRSWAVPDEPSVPLFTQRRLLGMGAAAAVASLAVVLALRGSHSPVVAAAGAPIAAPAKVDAPVVPPTPAVAPAPPAAAESATAAIASAPTPAVPPAAVAPAAPAAVAPATPAPAPAAAVAPAAPVPAAPAAVAPRAPVVAAPVVPRPALVARRPVIREEPTVEPPRKAVAAADKAPSSRSSNAGDLFDDPR